MVQGDYLLRQVEQLGKVLGMLIFSKGNGKLNMEIANQAFKSEGLGFDIDELLSLDEENLIDFLKTDKNIDVKNLEKLADILLFVAENNISEFSDKLYVMSLKMYKYLEELESIYSFERNIKIDKIQKMIDI